MSEHVIHYDSIWTNDLVVATPESVTMLLLGLGLVGLAGIRRKIRNLV